MAKGFEFPQPKVSSPQGKKTGWPSDEKDQAEGCGEGSIGREKCERVGCGKNSFEETKEGEDANE
jgi:hypothetical protein